MGHSNLRRAIKPNKTKPALPKKQKPVIIVDRAAEPQKIEEWIAEHGVNKQPTKFVLPTTAFVSDEEAHLLIRKIKVKDPVGWRNNRPQFWK